MKILQFFLCWSAVLVIWLPGSAQTSFYYPLQTSFQEATATAPPLIAIPNGSGLTGANQVRPMPANACGGVGSMTGYAYEDDAGLTFYYPPGVGDCEYSLQWTWMFDEMLPSSYIRVLSFIHTDDSGLYLDVDASGASASLIYWYLQPAFLGFCPPVSANIGPNGVFDMTDLYQIIFTRTCDDVLRVYLNGALLGTYADTNQKFYPQGANPKLVLFRDTASAPACFPVGFPGEASPGFIADLIISDQAMTAAEVATSWSQFCPAILSAKQIDWHGESLRTGNFLSWQLSDRENIRQVSLQRRQVSQEFVTIYEQTLEIASQTPHTYLDRTATPGPAQYRLLLRDSDGATSHSFPIELIAQGSTGHFFPNPATDQIGFLLPDAFVGGQLTLYDRLGQQVFQQHIAQPHGHLLLPAISEGIYVLIATSLDGSTLRQHIRVLPH